MKPRDSRSHFAVAAVHDNDTDQQPEHRVELVPREPHIPPTMVFRTPCTSLFCTYATSFERRRPASKAAGRSRSTNDSYPRPQVTNRIPAQSLREHIVPVWGIGCRCARVMPFARVLVERGIPPQTRADITREARYRARFESDPRNPVVGSGFPADSNTSQPAAHPRATTYGPQTETMVRQLHTGSACCSTRSSQYHANWKAM